jgi:hypothetical protein
MTQVLALGGATCYLGMNNRNNSMVYCSISLVIMYYLLFVAMVPSYL